MKRADKEFVCTEHYADGLAKILEAFLIIAKKLDALVPTEEDMIEARRHFAHYMAQKELVDLIKEDMDKEVK